MKGHHLEILLRETKKCVDRCCGDQKHKDDQLGVALLRIDWFEIERLMLKVRLTNLDLTIS